MKFLIDAQLSPSLGRFFERIGRSASHVGDLGMRNAEDRVIWDYALREAMVVVTKDEDFASGRQHVEQGPIIVWLRVGNCSTAETQARLAAAMP